MENEFRIEIKNYLSGSITAEDVEMLTKESWSAKKVSHY